jgi:surface antigen
MKHRQKIYLLIGLIVLVFVGQWTFNKFNFNSSHKVGQPIDSLNGVLVFYNGDVGNSIGRNLSIDGYNLGMKYQCVEFVKRYYYKHLNHKMPDTYGNAKDFFDSALSDGQLNEKRNLIQYKNNSQSQPKVDDLLIFEGTIFNNYGHVAIVSKVTEHEIEIIQQNPGSFGKSRVTIELEHQQGKWKLKNERILGWLRK